MAIDPTTRRSRRALLASAVGGAAAVAAAQLARPATSLAVGTPVNLDELNPGAGTTTITTTAAAAAIVGSSDAADTGIGVVGSATYMSDGVAYSNVGVYGSAGSVDSTLEPAMMEAGVYGVCDASPIATGVWGASSQGYGMYGWGDYGVTGDGYTVGIEGYTFDEDGGSPGVGVLGYAGTPPATIPANTGVMAVAPAAGTALNVVGRTRFSRAGRAYVAAGKRYVDVTVSGGVTSSSQILATASKYVSGVWVQAAVYVSATKIRVYLNKTVSAKFYFTWMVLN